MTGAGGGIGLQTALDLIKEGRRVLAIDLKEQPRDFADIPPERFIYTQIDITNARAVQDSVTAAAEAFGGLGYLVNAAGVGFIGRGDGPTETVSQEILDKTFAINLFAAMNMVRACVPHMKRLKGGAMVHVSSIAGYRVMERIEEGDAIDAYQTSKAALISLSKSLALQYGAQGIRSNTVCPGSVITPMTAHIYKDPDRVKAMEDRTPLRQVGMPEDISNAIRFLLSDQSSFVTGADLVVDGGVAIKM